MTTSDLRGGSVRSRTSQVDITARVTREGRLLVVLAAEAKDYR